MQFLNSAANFTSYMSFPAKNTSFRFFSEFLASGTKSGTQRSKGLNQQIKDYLTEQIRQLQFSPFHPFIARLKAATLFNSFRFFGNEFQIWLPLNDIVSKPFFVVETLGTLSLNIHLKF